jgi:tetratricopeptide (TPR) repeat protein
MTRHVSVLSGLGAAVLAAGCASQEEYVIDVAHNSLYHSAEQDVQNRQYDSAIRKLEQAARYKPNEARTHFRLGTVLFLRGMLPDAAGEARQQYLARALAAHEVCRQLAPQEPVYAYSVGRDLVFLGRPTEALAPLAEAQDLAPDVPFIDVALGDAHRLLKQYDEAAACYRAGLTKPAQPAATVGLHEGLGETLLLQGRPEEALRHLDLARKSALSSEDARRLAARIEAVKPPATRPGA